MHRLGPILRAGKAMVMLRWILKILHDPKYAKPWE